MTRPINRYDELRERQQHIFNNLPLGFAYNEKQFNEMMQGWGLGTSAEDCKKIVRLAPGTYIKKVDRDLFHQTMADMTKEMDEAIKADVTGALFIHDMFLSELNNHEYGYTRDTTDAIEALGLTADEIINNPALYRGLALAMREIEYWCETHGM